MSSPSPAQPPAGPLALAAAGTRLRLDEGTRRRGPLVIGGSPLRFLRLSAPGAALVDQWAQGVPVGTGRAQRALAARLIDSGIAHPLAPAGGPSPADVEVVVPVRDRAGGLAATLAVLGPAGGVTVVDDGSKVPVAAAGVRVLRQAAPQGPAAARNRGWMAATRPFVAFVDADCAPAPGWLEGLLPYFAEPRVAAVAPRITATPAGAPAALAAFDRAHSPLDLGARPGPVRPRSWVPYVPTACLVVRRACLEAVGGFDPSLQAGEDVDLVWRLAAAGWAVRYEPAVEVAHPVRRTWTGWAAQRYRYGRSAAGLAERHGSAVAPLDVSPWSAAAWAAGWIGHPLAGAALAAGSTLALARRAGSLPARETARAAAAGHLHSGAAIARALRREWWPLALAAALVSRRARRALLWAAAGPAVADWARHWPAPGPLRWCALYLADGVAYGAGVWAGCLAGRTPAALRPLWAATKRVPARPPSNAAATQAQAATEGHRSGPT